MVSGLHLTGVLAFFFIFSVVVLGTFWPSMSPNQKLASSHFPLYMHQSSTFESLPSFSFTEFLVAPIFVSQLSDVDN